MSKINFILLSLAIIFLTIDIAVSQAKVKPLKQLQPQYEKIIHFDKDDYALKGINPDDYKGREGELIYGVQGLYAGDKYITVWDTKNVFVFDITTYANLATLTPPLSINDIVERDGVIYCLVSSSRIDNRIYVYDSFDSFREYIFVSQFPNLSEYKAFREQSAREKYDRQNKRMKPRLQRLIAPQLPRGMHIRTLDISEGKIYANIELNFLNIEQDFNIENDNGKFYMFTKQDILKKEPKFFPVLFNGTILSCNRKKLDDNHVKLEFLFTDLEYNLIRENEIVLESNDYVGKIVDNTPVGIIDDHIILRCLRAHFDRNYDDEFILIINLSTKETKTIELPYVIKNLSIMTNYFQYTSFSNSSAFLISYNSDLSFDILKVEVK
ncbi:MAG: hypothetical protein ACOY90_07750 [Candidatus Zhuqueibacterota bacterium]